MTCDTPFYVLPKAGTEKVPVPCGKCPPCRLKRVNDWVFRLLQEERNHDHAHFITLTYDTRSIPISENGFMTLKKEDLQLFWKRLRKLIPHPIKYYAVGEYGTNKKRPHYHAIVFGVPKTELFNQAWNQNDLVPLGDIHVGQVSSDSIAYTCKYINKPVEPKKFGRDDRIKEFSVMSKGLGRNYITPASTAYHKADIYRLHLTKVGGHKIGIPRYYKNILFSEKEMLKQRIFVQQNADSELIKLRTAYESLYGTLNNFTFEDWLHSQRLGRYDKHHSSPGRKDL